MNILVYCQNIDWQFTLFSLIFHILRPRPYEFSLKNGLPLNNIKIPCMYQGINWPSFKYILWWIFNLFLSYTIICLTNITSSRQSIYVEWIISRTVIMTTNNCTRQCVVFVWYPTIVGRYLIIVDSIIVFTLDEKKV